MTGPVDFIFGLHLHQPVGNFEYVLENAYQDAYLPFIETFKKFKKIKMSLHISSPLLEYFKEVHPDFITMIKEEVEKGRIEMLGGGFYEPILISIPERDIHGQINKMEEFLKENFSTHSRGIWLTERVWEPHLPSLLKNTGVEYTAVDDTHFIQAGFTKEMLTGYYITEDRGNTLGIFIINKTLRYLIPFELPDKTINKFKEFAAATNKPLYCMLDDGEKFGLWPNTKDWVYGKKYLEKFLTALEENSSWLKTWTLSDYFNNNPPKGTAYLPSCSYSEMLEWSMPLRGAEKIHSIKEKLKAAELFEETNPYITGGVWENFFSKYPESNYMHKKMLYLSNYLDSSRNKFTDKKNLQNAYTHLYKAQCNCPYWHGVFGGIYFSHLRDAIYRNLNKLHTILDGVNHPEKEFIDVTEYDIDRDSRKEILIDTDKLFISLKPSQGGRIEEISDKETFFNHLNTIARRKELYHNEILSETKNNQHTSPKDGISSIHNIAVDDTSSLKKYLQYDNYQRKSLIDHILKENTTLEDFHNQNFRPLPYSYKINSNSDKTNINLYSKNGSISISKGIEFSKGSKLFKVHISLQNLSKSEIKFKYGIEFNFSMLSDTSDEKYYLFNKKEKQKLSKDGIFSNASEFDIIDESLNFSVNIQMDKNCELWYFPVRAVTNSESGFERTYQSSCLIPTFNISLKEKDSFSLNLTYTMS